MDIDWTSITVDACALRPSYMSGIRLVRSLLLSFATIVPGKDGDVTEIVESSVNAAAVASGVKVHRSILVGMNYAKEDLKDVRGFKPLAPTVAETVTREMVYLFLWMYMFVSLIPSFELALVVSAYDSWLWVTLGVVWIIITQCLIWTVSLQLFQVIVFWNKDKVNHPIYQVACSNYDVTLSSFGMWYLLWGTEYFGMLLRWMGCRVEGRLWYFGSVLHEYHLLEFADNTVVDDSYVIGHTQQYHVMTMGRCRVAGVLHARTFALDGCVMEPGCEYGPQRATGKLSKAP
eukprot:CAMPEP_0116834190 /NCGR_PEP_ID=MMETSP0418-20121206/6853_1 /TAXON_ID=1158023 /ORGANISM="Astrosyne radiata, Strain 13vi08-1A" /LENGTH=288 /DNA_ID=CAMNT_0004463721 /DNA_START=773 /DNA_END=1642 /DNA_ORIENTATION=-